MGANKSKEEIIDYKKVYDDRIKSYCEYVNNDSFIPLFICSNVKYYSPQPIDVVLSEIQLSVEDIYPLNVAVEGVHCKTPVTVTKYNPKNDYYEIRYKNSNRAKYETSAYIKTCVTPKHLTPRMLHMKHAKIVDCFPSWQLTFWPTEILDGYVRFESDGYTGDITDTAELKRITDLKNKLIFSLAENEKTMNNTLANGELSDVGALYIERKAIQKEVDKLDNLPSPIKNKKFNISIKIPIGWSIFGNRAINVSLLK